MIRKSGFTLLEVVIALLILALGLASVFSLFGTASHSLYQATTDETLNAYAQTIFSELYSEAIPWSVSSGNLYNQAHSSFPSHITYDLEFTNFDAFNNQIEDIGKNAVLVKLTFKLPRGAGYYKETFQTILLK
jgi:prepilin-type N-terminal cleavage/methylation domain-containing protein